MPIPSPKSSESESDFHSRCMANPAMQEYDQDQRNAICYEKYKNKDRSDDLIKLSIVAKSIIHGSKSK